MFAIVTCCSNNPCLKERLFTERQKFWLKFDCALTIILTLGAFASCGMLIAGIGGMSTFAPVAFSLLALATLIVVADAITLMIMVAKRRAVEQTVARIPNSSKKDSKPDPKLKNKLDKLQKQHRQVDQEISQQEQQLATLKVQQQQARNNVDQQRDLERRQRECQAEIGDIDAQLADLKSQCLAKDNIKNQKTQQVSTKKGLLPKAQETLESSQKELQKIQGTTHNAQEKATTEKSDLEKRIKGLENEKQTLTQQLNELNQTLVNIDQQVHQNNQLEVNINKLTLSNKEKEQKLQEADSKGVEQEKKLKEEFDSGLKDFQSATNGVEEKTKEVMKLKEELAKAKEAERSAVEQYNKSNEELQKLIEEEAKSKKTSLPPQSISGINPGVLTATNPKPLVFNEILKVNPPLALGKTGDSIRPGVTPLKPSTPVTTPGGLPTQPVRANNLIKPNPPLALQSQGLPSQNKPEQQGHLSATTPVKPPLTAVQTKPPSILQSVISQEISDYVDPYAVHSAPKSAARRLDSFKITDNNSQLDLLKSEYSKEMGTLTLPKYARKTFVKPNYTNRHTTKTETADAKLLKHTKMSVKAGKDEPKENQGTTPYRNAFTVNLATPVSTRNIEIKKGPYVGIAHTAGSKSFNEDAYSSQSIEILQKNNASIPAEIHLVCDGHGDQQIKARFVAEIFPKQLAALLNNKELTKENIANAITESIVLIDAFLVNKGPEGGTTLSGFLYLNNEIYSYNVGDSGTAIYEITKEGKPTTYQMSIDHDPVDLKMRKKVASNGGWVVLTRPAPGGKPGVVEKLAYLEVRHNPDGTGQTETIYGKEGVLIKSRTVKEKFQEGMYLPSKDGKSWQGPVTLGGHYTVRVKHNGTQGLLPMVSEIGVKGFPCQPTICYAKMDKKTAEKGTHESGHITIKAEGRTFVIVASDGLWDNTTREQAGLQVQRMAAAGKTLSEMAALLAQAALSQAQPKSKDNITVMVVELN